FVVGGSSRIVDAFRTLIESNGSVIETDTDVTRVVVENQKAVGVETRAGRRVAARRAVICNVTPTQLYQRLLAAAAVPDRIAERARAFRYGRADMQIHVALSGPPAWHEPKLADVAVIHLTPGLDGVSRAVRDAEQGSARPDAARSPRGKPRTSDDKDRGALASRSRAPQHQPRRWRSLFGGLHARPISSVAAVPGEPQSPNCRQWPLPHRRVDASGSGARRHVGLSCGSGYPMTGRGWRVAVVERADEAGRAVTREVTLPGSRLRRSPRSVALRLMRPPTPAYAARGLVIPSLCINDCRVVRFIPSRV